MSDAQTQNFRYDEMAVTGTSTGLGYLVRCDVALGTEMMAPRRKAGHHHYLPKSRPVATTPRTSPGKNNAANKYQTTRSEKEQAFFY